MLTQVILLSGHLHPDNVHIDLGIVREFLPKEFLDGIMDTEFVKLEENTGGEMIDMRSRWRSGIRAKYHVAENHQSERDWMTKLD